MATVLIFAGIAVYFGVLLLRVIFPDDPGKGIRPRKRPKV